MMNDDDDGNEKYQKIQKQRQQFQRGILIVTFSLVCAIVCVRVWHPEQQQLQARSNSNPKEQPPPIISSVRQTAKDIIAPAKKKKQDEKENNNEAMLQIQWNQYDTQIRAIRKRVKIFETNKEAQELQTKYQDITRRLLYARYGNREPYRIEIELKFAPDDMATIVLEMGPSQHIPVSIYNFMEIARNYHGGAFHRNAEHVLQAYVNGREFRSLAFQEYSAAYPHKEGTVGYAGRPSGPDWYISIMDNSEAHGPGSQQDENPYEADACFGRVVEGYDDIALQRIHKMNCEEFCEHAKNEIPIPKMTILIPSGDDGYQRWIPKQDQEASS